MKALLLDSSSPSSPRVVVQTISARYSRKRKHPYTFATFLVAVLLAALHYGCDQPFDPKGSLDEQMVIFSVLSNDRDAQFVLVNANYMPEGSDPSEFASNTFVDDASVSISASGFTMSLTDTSFPRGDTTRYHFPIQAYVAMPFVPAYKASYQVTAYSPRFGTASGSTVIPGKAAFAMDATSQAVLRIPEQFDSEALIRVNIFSEGSASGYIFRCHVYYEVLKDDGQWYEERAEIPISAVYGGYTVEYARYPGMTPRPSSGKMSEYYQNGFYRAVIDDISSTKYQKNTLVYKWAVFTLVQVDEHLYKYYNTVHQYEDPYSVRLDEPRYSTVSGGTGIVGSYALDSLLVILPESFYGNH